MVGRARSWLLGLLWLLVALAAWGLIEPRVWLDEEHEEVSLPGLPPSWEGQRIAVLADLQVGMWLANTDMVRRAVARIVAGRPAAVLLAGDFLYEPVDEERRSEAREELQPDDLRQVRQQLSTVTDLLRPLTAAGLPVYAVLGNHDYLQDEGESLAVPPIADEVAAALRAIGVVVLRNQVVAIERGPQPLYLGGIDSLLAGRAEPRQVLGAIPDGAPRILLMHNPDIYPMLPPASAPLAIAGHTHGGQIRVPGLPHWSWMALKQGGRVRADGWIVDEGAPGNRLYVNRGIGFSSVPMRIKCPPELTWIRLRKAA